LENGVSYFNSTEGREVILKGWSKAGFDDAYTVKRFRAAKKFLMDLEKERKSTGAKRQHGDPQNGPMLDEKNNGQEECITTIEIDDESDTPEVGSKNHEMILDSGNDPMQDYPNRDEGSPLYVSYDTFGGESEMHSVIGLALVANWEELNATMHKYFNNADKIFFPTKRLFNLFANLIKQWTQNHPDDGVPESWSTKFNVYHVPLHNNNQHDDQGNNANKRTNANGSYFVFSIA